MYGTGGPEGQRGPMHSDPCDTSWLPGLMELDLRSNALEAVPAGLHELASLRVLRLRDKRTCSFTLAMVSLAHLLSAGSTAVFIGIATCSNVR